MKNNILESPKFLNNNKKSNNLRDNNYLKEKNIIQKEKFNSDNRKEVIANKIQKTNNIEINLHDPEKKINDKKNEILNNIEIQKSLIYNKKISNYFSFIDDENSGVMEITHFRKNSKDETKLRNKINLIVFLNWS